MPEYNGVDTDHPSIVNLIHNMTKQKAPIEEIMKRSGMPAEVVKQHQQTAPKA